MTIGTDGCYVLSSILALDPWHIVTSMGQYMLLAPFYINLLNIYAFSNLHDFSYVLRYVWRLGLTDCRADGVRRSRRRTRLILESLLRLGRTSSISSW